MKYLLLGVLAYVAWRWYVAQGSKGEPATQAPPPAPPTEGGGGAEKMVSCAQCGIHLPQSEAIDGTGALHFCSDEHRLRYGSQRQS